MTPRQQARARLYEIHCRDLANFAHRALLRGYDRQAFAVVLVEADDPSWAFLAEAINPDARAQAAALRASGEVPVVMTSMLRPGLTALVAAKIPSVAQDLLRPVDDDWALLLVLAAGGCDVRWIEPLPLHAAN